MTVNGNADVIELLEAYLEAARKNDFGHIAISMVGHPNIAALGFTGEIGLELSQREALGLLHQKFEAAVAHSTPPPRDESLDASHVCYNVMSGSLGHDFLVWLVTAEMTRRRENAPGPLKVGFWLGRDPDRFNRDSRKMWLDNLFRPALALIGAVEDSTAVCGRQPECYVSREIVAAAKRGEEVPRFKSTWTGHLGDPGITITLREADHNPERNSNLEAWLQFGAYLRDKGERVTFVRDTARAYEALGDFVACMMASLHTHARLKLYESAKLNFFVSNGPSALALFSDVPWLTFITTGDGVSSPKFWKDNMGVEPGGQYPWSGPHQRMVWKPDTFENIVEAYQAIAPGDKCYERSPTSAGHGSTAGVAGFG